MFNSIKYRLVSVAVAAFLFMGSLPAFASHFETITLMSGTVEIRKNDTRTFPLSGFFNNGQDVRYVDSITIEAQGAIWDNTRLEVFVNSNSYDRPNCVFGRDKAEVGLSGSYNTYTLPVGEVASFIMLRAVGDNLRVRSITARVSDNWVDGGRYYDEYPTLPPVCDPINPRSGCNDGYDNWSRPSAQQHCCNDWNSHRHPLQHNHKCYSFWKNSGRLEYQDPFPGWQPPTGWVPRSHSSYGNDYGRTSYPTRRPVCPPTPTYPSYGYGGGYGYEAARLANNAIHMVRTLQPYSNWGDFIDVLGPIQKTAGRLLAVSSARGSLSGVTRIHLINLRNSLFYAEQAGYIDDMLERNVVFYGTIGFAALGEELDFLLDEPGCDPTPPLPLPSPGVSSGGSSYLNPVREEFHRRLQDIQRYGRSEDGLKALADLQNWINRKFEELEGKSRADSDANNEAVLTAISSFEDEISCKLDEMTTAIISAIRGENSPENELSEPDNGSGE